MLQIFLKYNILAITHCKITLKGIFMLCSAKTNHTVDTMACALFKLVADYLILLIKCGCVVLFLSTWYDQLFKGRFFYSIIFHSKSVTAAFANLHDIENVCRIFCIPLEGRKSI